MFAINREGGSFRAVDDSMELLPGAERVSELPEVWPPVTLESMQFDKLKEVESAYQAAIQLPVSYMGTTFQADEDSQTVLTKSLSPGSVPGGFFWLDANNSQVSMTFPQLQGLAAAMLAQGQAAFAKKTVLKQQIRNATSVATVQAITWS